MDWLDSKERWERIVVETNVLSMKMNVVSKKLKRFQEIVYKRFCHQPAEEQYLHITYIGLVMSPMCVTMRHMQV